jgi:hypothetical protein
MKVLYLSHAAGADYQCDMLFHGLRSLLGPDCVDVNQIHFMYQGTPYPPFFSIYGLLPNIKVDRTDIINKITSKFFDLIIYGSIQRCQTFLGEVIASYPPSRIFFIDGEDDLTIREDMHGKGVYFKRELPDGLSWIQPIEFCIPKEKILSEMPSKIRMMAPLNPNDRSTYIYYASEASYYQQYAESFFGRTVKKGGWDCCRHYEIMAAGCIPYFEGLERCPESTMFFLPKRLLLQARALCDNWREDNNLPQLQGWQEFAVRIDDHLKRHLTTEAMAKYVLEKVNT